MIDLRNLGKGYPTRHGWKWIVRGGPTPAEAGQRWAILGRNGSGKSTLIRLIGGAGMPPRAISAQRALFPGLWLLAAGFKGALGLTTLPLSRADLWRWMRMRHRIECRTLRSWGMTSMNP